MKPHQKSSQIAKEQEGGMLRRSDDVRVMGEGDEVIATGLQ